MKQEIKPTELAENAIKLIGQEWMLIAAGNATKFNMMTASWGGVGYLWNRPVVFVFVRPERYTYEFTESNNYFTLTFFGAEYKKVLSILGSKSGRDIDKMSDSGLTPYFTERGTPAFEEARITIECRKMYGTMLEADSFIDKSPIEPHYTSHGAFHKMYVAEIMHVWIEQ